MLLGHTLNFCIPGIVWKVCSYFHTYSLWLAPISHSIKINLYKSLEQLRHSWGQSWIMTQHMNSLCRSCFFQLCQIRSIQLYLSLSASTTLPYSFIMICLNYCDFISAALSKFSVCPLQLSWTVLLGSRQSAKNSLVFKHIWVIHSVGSLWRRNSNPSSLTGLYLLDHTYRSCSCWF